MVGPITPVQGFGRFMQGFQGTGAAPYMNIPGFPPTGQGQQQQGGGIFGPIKGLGNFLQNNPGFVGTLAGIGGALGQPNSPAARLGELISQQTGAAATSKSLQEQIDLLTKMLEMPQESNLGNLNLSGYFDPRTL